MSIFSNIWNKITGHHGTAESVAAQIKPQVAATGAASAPQPAPAATATAQPVDVMAILTDIASKKGQPSNWRTSIVDLLKLLDLDSSLEARKQLATEVGYTGPLDGSAEMNIAIHKAVMAKLAANGGKVPADLKD